MITVLMKKIETFWSVNQRNRPVEKRIKAIYAKGCTTERGRPVKTSKNGPATKYATKKK